MTHEALPLMLDLYVTGESDASAAVRAALQTLFPDATHNYSLDVIDVLREPAKAEASRVFMTPTLVVRGGERPERRAFGDFGDATQLQQVLALEEDDEGA